MEAEFRQHRLNLSKVSSIEGMESVVATVSGYHGSERFNLIKLISNAGASYVGSMSRSVTHLVCWKFEGKKYDLARKFKTIIVNHRWIEDCIKQRKRVSERPYLLRSGQDVGPLLLEVPPVSKKEKVLSEKYHVVEDVSDQEDTDLIRGRSARTGWTDSMPVDEDSLPNLGKNKGKSLKPKTRSSKRISKAERRSDFSGFVVVEYEDSSSDSSTGYVRAKRKISKSKESDTRSPPSIKGKSKISNGVGGTSLAKPCSRRRRLAKKHIAGDVLGSVQLRSSQEGQKFFQSGESSDDGFHNCGETNRDFVDLEETAERDTPHLQDRASRNEYSDCGSIVGEIRDTGESEQVNRVPRSTELSCVICWAKFSSSRGVLPCGHRFCYSCIQEWADHEASLRHIPTCPLCKASFGSITMLDDAGTSDQKIYSQTIPCGLSTMDVYMVPNRDGSSVRAEQPSSFPTCSQCRSQEPVELLERCEVCKIRCIHIYCLDPPLFPWTCTDCKDLRRHYRYSY